MKRLKEEEEEEGLATSLPHKQEKKEEESREWKEIFKFNFYFQVVKFPERLCLGIAAALRQFSFLPLLLFCCGPKFISAWPRSPSARKSISFLSFFRFSFLLMRLSYPCVSSSFTVFIALFPFLILSLSN